MSEGEAEELRVRVAAAESLAKDVERLWPHRTPHRTAETAQQIADARAEPTIEELRADVAEFGVDDPAQHAKDGRFAAEPPVAPSLTLTGPRLAAYLRIEAAAKAAHAAQAGIAATGHELRDAFAELCKAVTG